MGKVSRGNGYSGSSGGKLNSPLAPARGLRHGFNNGARLSASNRNRSGPWQDPTALQDRLYTQVARQEGLYGFYRGFGAVALGSVPANLAYFGGYEGAKALLPGTDLAANHQALECNALQQQ